MSANTQKLPGWAEELKHRYLRGESSQFVLHGNVHDVLLYEGKLYRVAEFLAQVLFAHSKDNVLRYNVSTGVQFSKRAPSFLDGKLDELLVAREPAKVLPLLERALTLHDRTAVILEYADTIAPAADTSFSTFDDRAAVVTLHRWSLLRSLEQSDSIVVVLVENLSDLHPVLVTNPRVATVAIPMPTGDERRELITFADPALSSADAGRFAETTAGLKAIQIASMFTPPPVPEDAAVHTTFVLELLAGQAGGSAATHERAEKLAKLTQGMSKEEVRKLLAPDHVAAPPPKDADDYAEVDRLVAARKRELIERECAGLIEFVRPAHGFEAVGGMVEVKRDLLLVAKNMREGRRNRCPMGFLFTGPMGTGKTFVAEAFAKESGLTAIKLKNFRSKWVGATEGNLERILNVVKSIGQVIVIIDEGDRAFGGGDESDGGTSSRVMARIKEFMSDTENRGRVLFILMTNRPDKLDVDIKRAGRLDRKIPFLYAQSPDEVEVVLRAQLHKAKVVWTETAPLDSAVLGGLVGYSNADLEAVVLLAADYAVEKSNEAVPVLDGDDLRRAVADYLPSRDVKMIEYMELLAVFEASNRRLLPKKYADMPLEGLQERLDVLQRECARRR